MSLPIADNIRNRRTQLGWSLKQLSEASGVSTGMLSEIERGTKSPTVGRAYQIAQALGCSIGELLEAGLPPGLAVTRKAQLPSLVDPSSGVRRQGFPNPLLHGGLDVAIYELPPRCCSGEMAPNRPGTLEQVLVLEGELLLQHGGHEVRLEAGDGVVHGVQSTEYRNPSQDADCRFLVLVDRTRC